MLVTRDNPVGIDLQIQKLQQFIHDELIDTHWADVDGIAGKYAAYGRCYRNNTNEGYTSEVYTGNGNYKPVAYDDKYYGISFFGVGETITTGPRAQVPVHLTFWVNLSKLADAVDETTDRIDEHIRLMIFKLVKPHQRFGFRCEEIVTGWDNVFREYPALLRRNADKYRDMHPYHVFRFNFQLQYNPEAIN